MAASDNLRVGDAEREAAATSLGEHYAHGRLTHEEFQQRLDATFAARTYADLNRISADLPHGAIYPAPPVRDRRTAWAPHSELPVAEQPRSRYQQHGHPGRGKARRGVFPELIVLFALLLVIINLHFSLMPAPIVIMLAIFGLARRILRRVFGWSRSAGGPPRRPW